MSLLLLSSLLPYGENSPHRSQSNPLKTLTNHVPPALNPPMASLDPIASKILTMALKAYRISALAACLVSFLTIPAHGVCPHWPPCPSLNISRPWPLLFPFLARCFPRYLHSLLHHFNLVSEHTSFPQRGFSWLALINSHPVPSYTIILLLLYLPSQLLSLTDPTPYTYVSVFSQSYPMTAQTLSFLFISLFPST